MAVGYRTGYEATEDVPSPLLKWSAVMGGLVLGLALLLLLSALWLAFAYGSDLDVIRDNVDWFIGGSAIAALFVAGILTGYLSGVRGAGTGMLHGFTLWGVLIVVAITVGVPSLLNVFGLRQVDQAASAVLIDTGDDTALWVTFWTILGGFVAAGFGGMLGGLMTRAGGRTVVSSTPVPSPATTPAPAGHHVVVTDEDDRREDVGETTVVRR
ncbi:MAG TPA: hypothetical protein VF235_04525 [Actinomycetota bacterium]